MAEREPTPTADGESPHSPSRRTFLKVLGATGGAAAAAAAGTGVVSNRRNIGYDPATAYDGDPSLGVDRIVRTTCSPNCTGSCGQLAFVRDDRVVKIQQAADYPDEVYNPRGCMKGLSFIHNIHGEDRVMTPLVRTGPRGSGEFRAASWDEVLDRIAGELRRIGDTHGWDAIHVFGQVPGSGYVHKGANYRASALLGMSHGTSFDFNGDLPMGMPITFGVQNAEHETKDWANSAFLLIVGANPLDTRIPDAHFLLDAAEKGARLVVVDPVYSATASKADTWAQIAAGTDAAFALGCVNVILSEGLADLDFVRTYTDGALLVRDDTGKRLRSRDVDPAAIDDHGQTGLRAQGDEVYVVRDRGSGHLVAIGTERLGFPDDVDAALEGEVEVPLADGSRVSCRPGWAHVTSEVARWTPETVAEITGLRTDLVERIARAYATESPAAILMGGGSNHWFHGDHIGRAYALLATVTGNIGRSGGGFSVYVGQYRVRVDTSPWWTVEGKSAPIVPTIYFLRGESETMHPSVPYPKSGFKALFCTFSNFLVQSPDLNRLQETIDGLDLFVVVDPQMTDTAKGADIVLPATTWYEKTDLTATPVHPFVQLQQPAIPPVGASRDELWIWRELIRRIDPAVGAAFDYEAEDAIEMMLAAGDHPDGPTYGMTLERLRDGPMRLNRPDPDIPFGEQIERLEPFPPRVLPAALEATQRFVPTGRIEFYKEEDGFLERGETVPTYKVPHDDGVHDPGRYPLRILSPHSKWRIHSTYGNNPWMDEIHGGKAPVLMHPDDARARGIRDGDAVEVFNGRGRTVAWAKVTEAHRPGSVTLSEGWWFRSLAEGKGVNELTTSDVNPIHELHFVPNMWSPSTPWKDCRCEVRRA